MLHADKRALEQNLKVNLLRIREKELRFYTDNCVAIGTQASLLSGFAYSGLIQIVIPEGRNDTLITAYLCVTVTAMGLELIAVINAMLCSMLGPGLALRGPDGSMHRAVDEMLEEYRLTFFFFGIGLVAFHFSAILFAWVEFIWTVALAMSVVLSLFLYGMFHYFLRIYARFKVPPSLIITGRFDTDSSVYERTINAAELRSANLAHNETQSVRQQVKEYLYPISTAQSVLRDTHGPADAPR
ncbi:hypothetical protein T492DRAFT_954666 [Pavlovales sp. CCMP2436]|nr:hypothetical protein T492DRAFT_954666 [Pavlovales sp. CCMP2436]